MRNVWIAILLATVVAAPAAANARRGYEDTVVGLLVTYQNWDEDRPWSKRTPKTKRASGVVVEGPYILTTAQTIAQASLIRLERYGRAVQGSLRPVLVDPELDLALLEVDDPEFFETLEPARLASESPTGVVRSVRWKGQQLETGATRIQRLEVQEAFFGELEHVFLVAQTDLLGGGWAEPAFDGDRLVGMTASQNEQLARLIPIEIIGEFLDLARDPEAYRGFPVLGVQWQVNEDRALARFLGQKGEPSGVIVRQVPWGSSACGVLEPRDVLLSIDGHKIDAEGYYSHPRLGRLRFTNIIVDGHRVGDRIPARVLRDGREVELTMTLRAYTTRMHVIPSHRGDDLPPFVIAGGLIFRELDGDYLRSWGRDWSSVAPLQLLTPYYLHRETQSPERRRIVLIASVLPAPYNVGYQGLRDTLVESINGVPIDSITDVRDAFGSPVDGFHVIVLERNPERREVVLDAAAFELESAAILENYRIPMAERLPDRPPPHGGPDACPGDF